MHGHAKTGGAIRLASLLLVLALLEGCGATGSGVGLDDSGNGTSAVAEQKDETVSWAVYTPFFDQGDHLKQLISEGKLETAAKLYDEQKDFFRQNKEKQKATLTDFAARLNARHDPALQNALEGISALKWPAPAGQWQTIKNALSSARDTLTGYPAYAFLQEPEYRSDVAEELGGSISALKQRIESGAPEAFAAFDHFGDKSFFGIFPVDIEPKSFFITHADKIKGILNAAKTKQLRRFAANYSKEITGEDWWGRIGGFYVAASLKESGGTRSRNLKAVLKAISGAKKAGFEPKNVPGLKIGFVEVTSRTLLKEGQIEFPTTVKVDLPVKIAKADLEGALTNPTAKTADFLIVFDVALAKAKRRVTKAKKVKSKVLTGYEKEPNPDYDTAQIMTMQAQSNYNSVQLQSSINSSQSNAYASPGAAIIGSLLQGLASGIATASAKKKLDQALLEMQNTPRYVEKPVYAGYNYEMATVKGTKTMTVHYYIIDRKSQTYFKSTFDVVEKKNFQVAYNVAESDPDKEDIVSDADTEETVAEWEEQASTVKLSQLVDHYLESAKRSKPLPSLISLRKEMLRDKNKALAKYEANKFDARPLNDPRFDSVVVIYVSAKRGLGSGFFVKPDVVLTNWHVVKENKFVEMKMYDGRETFGKVIAKDVRLDLALIKVQSRGKPVRFYTKRNLDLGATVEAIGHPRRFEFSITRGVISAVRRLNNINIGSRVNEMGSKAGGGKGVLFIQIDAPISPGNSGGPLFLGDRVIGVNTWNRRDGQNLNFSVHYSEVIEFIKDYLQGFQVKAEK